MAKVLSSISFNAPAAPVSANVSDIFAFSGTPGFTGTGGVQRYDFKWEVDDGGGYVTIAAATGLTTAGTNPVSNTNSQAAQSITVTGTNALLAEDVESVSEVTTPALTQVHALLANDTQSNSELSLPILTQV